MYYYNENFMKLVSKYQTVQEANIDQSTRSQNSTKISKINYRENRKKKQTNKINQNPKQNTKK